jgi:hypothetical protein
MLLLREKSFSPRPSPRHPISTFNEQCPSAIKINLATVASATHALTHSLTHLILDTLALTLGSQNRQRYKLNPGRGLQTQSNMTPKLSHTALHDFGDDGAFKRTDAAYRNWISKGEH